MNMHLSIIAQFQDRATRGLRHLLRLQQQHERMQKAYGNATSQAARQQAELARANQHTARAMGNEASAAARLRAALHRVNEMIRKQVSLRARLRRAGSLAREGLGRMGHAAALGAGIYGTVQAGAASLASLVVGPAAQVEQYQMVLESTMKSSAKAKEALAWVTKFAVKTPYELNEVMKAFVTLRARGLDPTNGLLKTLGDTAAAMNLPLMQAVEAISDAITGENERLKEFGITASKMGGKITYYYTDAMMKQRKLTVLARDRAAIQQALMKIWNEKYAGAMEKLSKTWHGMMSNMKDMWFKFRLMVAHSGVFEWLKGKLRFLLDTFNKLEASGRLQQIARQIGQSIITGLKNLWQFGLGVWAVLKRVGAALEWAADKLGGWNNLAMLLMAVPVTNVFVNAASGVMLLGRALLVLAANPLTLVIGALAAAAAYLVDWPAVLDAARAAWARMKAAIGSIDLTRWAVQARAALGAFVSWLAGIGASWFSGFRAGFGGLGQLSARLAGIWNRLAAAGRHLLDAFSGLGGGGALRRLMAILGRLGGMTLNVFITGLEASAWALERLAAGIAWVVRTGRDIIAFFVTLPARVQAAWQALKQWLTQPFDPFPGLRQRVQHIINVLTGLPQRALAAMQAVATTIASLDIGALIRGVDWTGLLQRGLNAALTAVRDAFANLNLFEAGVKALQSFWNGLKSVMGNLASWAKNKLSSIFRVPSWARGWFGGSKQPAAQAAAQPQARAAGGPFGRGPLLVGERGPELLYANRGGWVAHNDNLKRIIDLSRRAAASIAAVSVATHMALAPPRIAPASPPARLIAGGSGQQVARAGGQQVTVHYAPQVTVQGAAGAEDVQAALDAHLDRLLDALERRQRERERLEF